MRIKHSEIAHGMVKSVDKSGAEAIPGVIKVLTCFDVPDIPFRQRVIRGLWIRGIRMWQTGIC